MKLRLSATRPAAAVAALLAAGVLLASCSSSSDGEAKAADSTSTSTTSTAASSSASSSSAAPTSSTGAEATTPADGPSSADEKAITAAAEAYLAAVSSGKVDAIAAISCQAVVDTIPADVVDGPVLDRTIVVDSVTNIQIDGATAVADVTASLKEEPDTPSEMETLAFANENGWKVCQ